MTLTSRLIMASGSVGGSESYTTPGTYYWTAPAGATKVDVTGQGGSSGTSVSWSSSAPYKYMIGGIFIDHPSGGSYNAAGTAVGSSLTYATVRSWGNNQLSAWQSVTTSSSGGIYSGSFSYTYFNYSTSASQWYRWPQTNLSGTYRRTGTVSAAGTLVSASGTVPTTGYVSKNLYPSNIQKAISSNVNGGNSTAFSQTFNAGGSQSTVTNISVSAGTQYTIVVGADQGSDTAFVSFDYY